MEDGRTESDKNLTLVARKPCFGLPTACPTCLPVYLYLRFSRIPFTLEFNSIHPDSDHIPFVEYGEYVAYNNEKGGVIKALKEDNTVDLDSDVRDVPEWISMKAMVERWLGDAIKYELWVECDGTSAHHIYYSDLPWPIGKILYYVQVRAVKQVLGITSDNVDIREKEIYSNAAMAYGALSSRLGEQSFFFEDRPTSLDAAILGHVLFTLHALPETSVLRSKLLEHPNLVKYAEKLRSEYIDVPHSEPSPSSATKKGPSNWSSKPKRKPKKEKTEEEKKFRRRSKYFLATQFVAILVFVSVFAGSSDDAEVEVGDEDNGFSYE